MIANEIQNSDMSGIPFEEFEGFPICDFDFTKTGNNIDFDLIDLSFIQINNIFIEMKYLFDSNVQKFKNKIEELQMESVIELEEKN